MENQYPYFNFTIGKVSGQWALIFPDKPIANLFMDLMNWPGYKWHPPVKDEVDFTFFVIPLRLPDNVKDSAAVRYGQVAVESFMRRWRGQKELMNEFKNSKFTH